MNYLKIRTIYHSAFAEEEKARRKASIKNINRDFFEDLPKQVCDILDTICWAYNSQPWFEEAWEKYRKHVLDAGLGGKIKMPGFVFNEYIDKFVDEQEKKMQKELIHMDVCDVEELYHYGIKGQKWGVRRYQNDDGTLTAAGQARYNSDGSNKDPKKMSDEDLKKSNQRLQSEQLYKQLRDRDNPAKEVGKTALASLVATGATFAATYAGSRIYAKASGDSKLDKGKSVLLALLASIGTGASVIGGRVGQVNVQEIKKK